MSRHEVMPTIQRRKKCHYGAGCDCCAVARHSQRIAGRPRRSVDCCVQYNTHFPPPLHPRRHLHFPELFRSAPSTNTIHTFASQHHSRTDTILLLLSYHDLSPTMMSCACALCHVDSAQLANLSTPSTNTHFSSQHHSRTDRIFSVAQQAGHCSLSDCSCSVLPRIRRGRKVSVAGTTTCHRR